VKTNAEPGSAVSGTILSFRPKLRRVRASSRAMRVLLVGGLTLIGGIGAAVPLAAASTSSSTTTLKFVSVTKKNIVVPKNNFIEVDMDETSKGKPLGADTLVCKANGPKKAVRCAASIDLPDGDLFAVVIPTNSPTTGGPLVGGTGRYANAKGTVFGTTVSKTKADIVVTIRH
jgi:hypothetical protein